MKKILTHEETRTAVKTLSNLIKVKFPNAVYYIYPIPRGGIPVAYHLMEFGDYIITENISDADFIVDDVIDSGNTYHHYNEKYPDLPFYALYDKSYGPVQQPWTYYEAANKTDSKVWLVFPWEGQVEQSVTDNVVRMLQYVGEDPNREGLRETPHRVVKAWEHWCSGYSKKPEDIMTTFSNEHKYDQMITIRDLPFYSMCCHHMAPFFGTADISYIPKDRIVGLSKFGRVLDIYSRRLQVQESLTNEIANCLMDLLEPLGVGVRLKARHMCMESRGLSKQGSHTITTALLGTYREIEAKSEFLNV